MKQFTMNGVVETIQNAQKGNIVVDYYVTSALIDSFNEMEGNIYHVNIKLVTKEGYKNKIIQMVTNSTYIDDFDFWDNSVSMKDNFQAWLECI